MAKGKILGVSVKGKDRKWVLIGIAGVATIGVLWASSYLIKPGRKTAPFHLPFFGGGGGHHAPPAHHPMHHGGPPHPAAHAMLANAIPNPHGPHGHLPVGGRISGIAGGGYNFKWPSGRIGHPGGYGVSGGYYASM
jgi:hypothetical protein